MLAAFGPVPALVILVKPANMKGARLDLQLTRGFRARVISTSSERLCTRLGVKATAPAPRRLRHIPRRLMKALRLASCCDTTRCRARTVRVLRGLFVRRRIIILANNSVVCISTVYGNVSSVPAMSTRAHRLVLRGCRRRKLRRLYTRLQLLSPRCCHVISLGGPGQIVRTLRVYCVAKHACASFHARRGGGHPFRVVGINLAHSQRRLCSHVGHQMSRVVRRKLLRRMHSMLPCQRLGSLGAMNCGRLFGCLSKR